MLRVQDLVPRVPPRLLAPALRAFRAKRLVDWSFEHYLAIAPPEFAAALPRGGSAQPRGGTRLVARRTDTELVA